MKRRLFTLAIFLLLGAVVNVAVAWGCALWIGVGAEPHSEILQISPDSERFSGWIGGSWQRPGALRILSVWVESPEALRSRPHTLSERYVGALIVNSYAREVRDEDFPTPSWSRLSGNTTKPPPGIEPSLIEDGRGWPMLAMRCSFRTGRSGSVMPVPSNIALQLSPAKVGKGYYGASDWGSLTLSNWAEPRVLPIIPIWSGFAVNTILYAAILWLPIRGLFALRRHIRRKRGLCVACGYDLRHADHEVCPECGAAIPSPLRERARVRVR